VRRRRGGTDGKWNVGVGPSAVAFSEDICSQAPNVVVSGSEKSSQTTQKFALVPARLTHADDDGAALVAPAPDPHHAEADAPATFRCIKLYCRDIHSSARHVFKLCHPMSHNRNAFWGLHFSPFIKMRFLSHEWGCHGIWGYCQKFTHKKLIFFASQVPEMHFLGLGGSRIQGPNLHKISLCVHFSCQSII